MKILCCEIWIEAVADALGPFELDEAVAAERLDVHNTHLGNGHRHDNQISSLLS